MSVRSDVAAPAALDPAPRWPGTRPFLRWTSLRWQAAAIAVALTSWSLALAAVVLLVVHGSPPGVLAYWVMDVSVAVVHGAACLLMLPRSRHPAVWILVVSALGCGVSGLLTPYLAIAATDPGVWAPAPVWIASTWVWVPGTYASMMVLPWLVSPWRMPRWVAVLVALASTVIAWRVLVLVTGHFVGLDNPLAVMPGWFYDVAHRLRLWPDWIGLAVSFAGVGRLLWIRLRAAGDEGRGYGWLTLAQLFLAVAFVPVVLPMPEAIDRFATDFAGASLIAAQPFLPGALLVVVLGHRLWGIDVAVDRATVWLVLTGVLVTCYLLIVWLAQQTLDATDGVASVVGMAAMLVASQPLRSWVQTRVDRLVYGPATDPGVLLESLGATGSAVGHGTSLEALVDALVTGLRLGGVAVLDDRGEVVAAAGRRPGQEGIDAQVPLVVDGQVRGSLVLAPAPGQRLDTRTRRLVEQMGGVIAVFLELAQANERLDAASARLVEVRHEERRMLRRDLHDGMGPALAGVGLGLAAVQRKLQHDPDGAGRLLAELHDEVGRRTEDLRLLARSLLPAALDDGDLVGALRALGARFETAGVRVHIDSGGLGALDTRRQLAIYHVAAEAVLNAHRHGHAREVTVSVGGGGSAPVVLEVRDDGAGIAAAAERGVGLRSMEERAQEQSGSLQVTAGPDGRGTTIRMELP